MMKHAISIAVVLTLAGCGGGTGGGLFGGGGGGGLFGGGGGGGGLFNRNSTQASTTAQIPADETPRPEERPGDETAEATAGAEAGDGLILGFAVASLGDANVPGLWMETPLVSAEGPGRVVGPDGRTVSVTLRPSGGGPGSGSRLSLQAMQALGIDLAELPTVTVISDA